MGTPPLEPEAARSALRGARASVFEQLAAEYPEVSGPMVAEALEQAQNAAARLVAAGAISRAGITALARDRLDVIRIRSTAALRPALTTVAGAAPSGRLRRAGSWVSVESARFDRVVDSIAAHTRALGVAVCADTLCHAAAADLSVDAVAVTVPGGLVTAQTIGVHGAVGRRLEELQVTLGEGPSLDCLASGRSVLVDDLDEEVSLARWPEFVPVAVDAGVDSMVVLPMRIGAARFGALVLYLDRVGGLGVDALAEGKTFAAVALEMLLEHTGGRDVGGGPGPAAEDRRRFFDDRPEIHQATGMVSIQLGIDLGAALLRLRGRAYAEDRLLSELASDVVARTIRFDREES